ncbi:hypothetical protein ACFYKX_10900 [Cytobacillus sp. FJAT-54145]|uniref:IDEAL domain-containing protein n=1 Tax=Cytobacillus spartinae TaxID=3299023 RepID=A0ABW6KDX9_9BACI
MKNKMEWHHFQEAQFLRTITKYIREALLHDITAGEAFNVTLSLVEENGVLQMKKIEHLMNTSTTLDLANQLLANRLQVDISSMENSKVTYECLKKEIQVKKEYEPEEWSALLKQIRNEQEVTV